MKNYSEKEEKKVVKKLESITCDVCKKEYNNGLDNMDIYEIQEFTHIDYVGGYGSIFGDDQKVQLDICQHCLKKTFGEKIRLI